MSWRSVLPAAERVWLVAVVLLSALIACTSPQRLTRFPHDKHLASAAQRCGEPGQPPCLSCASCHAGVSQGRTRSRPSTELCESCHEPSPNLAVYVTRPAPLELGPRAIVFSHDQHLALQRINGQCVGCHAGAVSEQPGPRLFPTMEACLSCHEHESQFDAAVCTNCHERGDLPQLRPESFMRHDATWLRHHAEGARRGEALCEACHSEQDCTDCHGMFQNLAIEERQPDAIERDLVHRADFMTRHAIEAEAQPTTCVRCHQPRTCDGCHVQRGVSGNALGALNPHPPGWNAGSGHGLAARRQLFQCASCHDQGAATNCIRCHSSGGPGGNPHPNGWSSSRTPDAQMCRYCHGG